MTPCARVAGSVPERRPRWKNLCWCGSALTALAVAAWLVPASAHIVDWSTAGPERLAVLAPLRSLEFSMGISLLLTGAAAAWSARDAGRLEGLARAIRPMCLLWLWVVPFVPWVPDRLPLVLVLTGPLRWLVAGVALLAVLVRSIPSRWFVWRPRWPTGGRAVFVTSLVVFLACGTVWWRSVGLRGDEPHYLVITQSVWIDHDLQIENNHQRQDYRQYYGGPLAPDYLARGLNGAIYSIHAPGLPILVLPGFVVLGAWGAVATVALLAACAALAVFRVARRFGGPGVGWMTWMAVCLTVPFVPYAWSVFPEMPAAAVVAWALWWLVDESASLHRQWIWRGVVFAVLPWLHTKYIVLLAAICLAVAVREWRHPRRIIAVAVPVALSVAGWLASFHHIYGSWDPQVAYGAFASEFVTARNIPRGVLGALFDAKFGLLVYAPVTLVALFGAWQRTEPRTRATALGALGVAAGYVISSSRMYMWWGGESAPARFLVPVMPLLAPGMAIGLAAWRSTVAQVHRLLLLMVSMGVAVAGLVWLAPPMLLSPPHGISMLAEWLQGGAPLAVSLPTFTEQVLVPQLWRLAAVAASVWVVAAGARFAGRRARGPKTVSAAAVWCAVEAGVLLVCLSLVLPVSIEGRVATVRQGRQAAMDRFDPTARRALRYEGIWPRRVDPAAWQRVGSLVFDLPPGEEPDRLLRLTEGLTLPAGEFDVIVRLRRPVDAGTVRVTAGHDAVFAEAPLLGVEEAVLPLHQPVTVSPLWVQASERDVAAAVRQVEIRPRSLVTRSERWPSAVGQVERLGARSGAYLGYVADTAYPEGGVFWTRGTQVAEVVVVPSGAHRIGVTLHVGPQPTVVDVAVGRSHRSETMAPGETRTVEEVVPAGSPWVAVGVRASASFMPADTDPRSTDRRVLGVQVRVEPID